MHQLSPYAAQCLAALQRLLPDLATLAVAEGQEFTINATSPRGWPLWLALAGEGILVGFAEWHGHFDWHEDHPEQDAADDASLVQELRNGKLELVAWYTGDQYAGSATREVGTVIKTPTWLQPEHQNQRVETRKWVK